MCNSHLFISHTFFFKRELPRVCDPYAPNTHKVPNTADLSHDLSAQSVLLPPPPDTRRGSIAPIQPCIVSLQVPTTEIRCRWDRCLLTQPLHDNEATASGRNLQRSVSGYEARWAGRCAAPLIPFLLTDSRGPTDGSPRVNRLQDQVQIGSYSFGYVWDLITSRYPRLRNVFPALCLLKKC